MTSYTRKILCVILLLGALFSCAFHGHEVLGKMAQFFGYLSGFIAITLAFDFYRSRKKPGRREKQKKEVDPPEDNVEQAIRIMTLQDDGRRHYENLPRAARRKSMFGGRMID